MSDGMFYAIYFLVVPMLGWVGAMYGMDGVDKAYEGEVLSSGVSTPEMEASVKVARVAVVSFFTLLTLLADVVVALQFG